MFCRSNERSDFKLYTLRPCISGMSLYLQFDNVKWNPLKMIIETVDWSNLECMGNSN